MYSDIFLSATVKPQKWRKMHLQQDPQGPELSLGCLHTADPQHAKDLNYNYNARKTKNNLEEGEHGEKYKHLQLICGCFQTGGIPLGRGADDRPS
jgi:hypothetical protein